jgi:hypothetical protein
MEPAKRIVNLLNSKDSSEYETYWIRHRDKKRGLYITEDRAYLVHPWNFRIVAECQPKLFDIFKMVKVLTLQELMQIKNHNNTVQLSRSDFLQ